MSPIEHQLRDGLVIKSGPVEMVDLRFIMDQYSNRTQPRIQISHTRKIDMKIINHGDTATAGTDSTTISMYDRYEDALYEFKQLTGKR